jgi:DNA-binding response OmpR family regulator
VLVVDDDAATREVIGHILTWQGYEVQTARNGREALALLAWYPAQLVLLDAWLLLLNGTAWVTEIRARGLPRRVVLMSDTGNRTYPAAGLPVDGVLAKPFDLADLILLVQAHCLSTEPVVPFPLAQSRW